ncbi:hypothetical protein SCP_1103610 [Sparassis crispa]|uniref:Uncharacterized protein n=1 Tax=Sparassis crispa TaxID=139825 RepID=A0A401GZU0_9APHY|nr:hypothetical protein SCP_1103610 [Sparassis crispa]GBE87684.1 hypothetical protein SCP_1103610 [Sparassis crispa]
MSAAVRIQCRCARCSLDLLGFKYQSKQVCVKHLKLYGPYTSVPESSQTPNSAPLQPTTHHNIAETGSSSEPRQAEHRIPEDAHLPEPVLTHDDGAVHPGPHGTEDDFEGFDDFQPQDVEPDSQPSRNSSRSPSPYVDPPPAPGLEPDDYHEVLPPDIAIPGSEHDNDDDEPSVIIPAFSEESYIRMAYLHAVMGNTYQNLTWNAATEQLNNTLDCLSVQAGQLPLRPQPARTLATARRRLGIDPDAWIIQYAICPVCWKHHTPRELKELESPACTVLGCSGSLYLESLDSKGKTRRQAIKISPQSLHDFRNDQPGHNRDEDFVMEDIYDSDMLFRLTTGTIREINSAGTVRDRPREDGQEPVKLTSHRYGLALSMNLDWFGLLSGRPHSTGPIYLALNNLPRDQRYFQLNVICLAVLPGPGEPNQQQLNHALEPGIKEMIELHKGIEMSVHDDDAATVYADFLCDNCDTPAARKVSGTASHNHDFHPCLYCGINILDINKSSGYDNSRPEKDDYKLLKHAFSARGVSIRRESAILCNHGVRWSIMNLLAGWLPSSQTVLDFMHAVFLGIIAHLYLDLLFKGYMFSGIGGDDSPKQKFEDTVNSVRWPSHVTRLPKNLGENQSLKKADKWRRLLTIMPILLWVCWKDEHDRIPNVTPPIPPNAKTRPTHSRNCKSIYFTILLLCAGICILASCKISMSQAQIGQDFLTQYNRKMQELGVDLTINNHLSTHFAKFIKLFGPVYGWWLFAFERFNGMFERVNTNGHDGGRMELTLMRHWIQCHLIYEYLLALPPEAHSKEREYVERVIKSEGRSQRGGMMTELAIYRSEATTDRVKLPRVLGKPINLRKFLVPGAGGIYRLALKYSQLLYPELHLIDDLSLEDEVAFIASRVVRPLTYIRKDGIRYGSTSNKRTKADRYVFIIDPSGESGERVPVEIAALLGIKVAEKSPHVCAVIRRMVSDENIPTFPWQT